MNPPIPYVQQTSDMCGKVGGQELEDYFSRVVYYYT